MFRHKLTEVYKDTMFQCRQSKNPNVNPGSFSTLYRTKDLEHKMEAKYDTMTVEIQNEDTFEATKKYVSADNNVVILNMASCFKPGGGVEHGAMAQEEELFRRSNYFMSLPRKFYPLNIGDTIYTPKVTVIKNKEYESLAEPFSIAAIAAAALRKPYLKKDKYHPSDKAHMTTIIENIFKVAYLHKHEILILGAIGCGAYGNPQEEVIEIFNTCLLKYWGCFKHVIFAVYSKRTYDVNYDMFKAGIMTKKTT